MGVVCFFLEIARASEKNIHNFFYISYMEPVFFAVAKII